jgi:hypothetical protein
MDLAFQIGGGVTLLGNTFLLLKLSFQAGRLVQKVEDIDQRVTRIETTGGCGEKEK